MAERQDTEKATNESDNKIMNDNKSNNNTNSKSLLKQKRFWIPLFIILIAAAAGWYWYQGQLGYVSTDDAFVDGNKLSLASKMLGRITSLYVDEGENVTQGELLVRLDSTDLIAQRNRAFITLKLAQDNIQLAQVNLSKAHTDYERTKQQYDHNIIPKEQYDHSKSALDIAQAQLNIAKTKVQTAKSQLNIIDTQLQNTTIYSPMNGVVAKRWVLEGDVVQPGQPIFSIYNLDSLWVTADLQETDIASVNVGQHVEIDVDSYPDHVFDGKVIQIGSNTASQFALIPPSNAAGNFTKITQRIPVKISVQYVKPQNHEIDPGSYKLLPGMSVEVKIRVQK